MAGFTTAFPTSAKSEYPSGAHRFQGSVTFTGTSANTSNHITSISAISGGILAPGMNVTGTNIAASSYIAYFDTATSFYMNNNATGTNTGLTATGDVFKLALGIASPTGTYGAATTNYSNLTGNSDEVSGTGYTAGGVTLATNISPATSGTGAYWQWSVNPSWTSATFSTSGCLIYNTSTGNRCVYVGSFGGTQTVTAGTLTLLQPTNGVGTSLLQIN